MSEIKFISKNKRVLIITFSLLILSLWGLHSFFKEQRRIDISTRGEKKLTRNSYPSDKPFQKPTQGPNTTTTITLQLRNSGNVPLKQIDPANHKQNPKIILSFNPDVQVLSSNLLPFDDATSLTQIHQKPNNEVHFLINFMDVAAELNLDIVVSNYSHGDLMSVSAEGDQITYRIIPIEGKLNYSLSQKILLALWSAAITALFFRPIRRFSKSINQKAPCVAKVLYLLIDTPKMPTHGFGSNFSDEKDFNWVITPVMLGAIMVITHRLTIYTLYQISITSVN